MNRKAEVLIKLINSSTIGPAVEIGSIRSAVEDAIEGFSTVYLARECKKSWRKFTSVELDPKNVTMANAILKSFMLPECVLCADGARALMAMPPLAFLYLDSSRFPEHTWEQFVNANLLEGATIAVDDAHPFDGHEWGKAQCIVEYLKNINMPFDVNYTSADTRNVYRMIHFIVPAGKRSGELPTCSLQRAHPV